jgi:hypothetical protein
MAPILIVLVTLVPVLLALLVYFFPGWFTLGHSNHGNLLKPPVKINVPTLPRVFDEAPLPDDFLHGKWTMVYLSGPHCGADCRDTLYVTRQIRLGMGRNIRRVQRLFVVRGDHLEGAERIHAEHPDLTVVTAAGTAGRRFAAQFTSRADEPSIFLVDPHGMLMMTYPAKAKPLGLIKDLRHLLKTNER